MAKRILVIEDQEDNRAILRDLLSAAGFELIEAVNGAEGVAKAAAEKPDLILMDIQMPVMDGYDATRHIKANAATAAIPVVAVTSYALSGDEAKAKAAGCDGYVTKPYSPRQMLSVIRGFLDRA
jgi:two-component system cell cycle response regulator DivK